MKTIGRVAQLPLLVKAGFAVGLVTGGGVGWMANPPLVGACFGALLGAVAGIVAGIAMQREDERGTERGRELDDIIGVTQGSLGAPPGSIRPGDLRRDPADSLALQSWAHEWLTPPPPAAR